MILFKRTADLAAWLGKERASGRSIGFVPTMGALHAGHISLINISKEAGQVTVCSIFVNPTQFNDPKDYQKYPITIEKDISLLEAAGADALFLPEVDEVYPGGTRNLEHYPLGELENILEGKYRPGHFQGVCQVMSRLLKLVRPDHLFMGQKDYQQCMVIERLLKLLEMPTRLHRCPILREADGLAMSSRNVRLSPEQREKSTAIYKALLAIQKGWLASGNAGGEDESGTAVVASGDAGGAKSDGKIGGILADGGVAGSGEAVSGARAGEAEAAYLERAREMLERADFRVDYIALADADTLEARTGDAALPPHPIVALIAAFQGEVRLIDNMVL